MRLRKRSILLAAKSDNCTPTGIRFRALNSSEAIRSPDGRLPLVIEPESSEELAPLLEWISAHTALLHQKLCLHGGLLFRGFKVMDAEDFEQVALRVDPDLRDKNPLDDGLRPHNSRFVFGATIKVLPIV